MKNRKGKYFSGSNTWRNAVLTRDNYTCRMCGKKVDVCKSCGRKQILHTHHILPTRYFPKYKNNVKNGITLCSKCHGKIPRNIDKVFNKVNVNLVLQ